jgi:O-antigen/teichoic acid export membrane protein
MLFELNRLTVVKNIAALFSGSALAQGATALALLLTARAVGVEGYGQFAACFALASVSSVVYNLGLDIWALREGGRTREKLGGLIASVLAIKVSGGTAWLAAITLLAPLIRPDVFPVELIFFISLSVLLDNLFASNLTAFKASLRNQYTLVLEGGADLVWLAATVFLIMRGEANPVVFVQARLVVQAAGLLVSTGIVHRMFPLKPTLRMAREALKAAFPFAASEFLAWASMRVDLLIVAFILGQYHAGLYSPSVGIVNALFLVPAAIYIVMVPVLTNLFTNNLGQAWQTAKRGILASGLVGAALSAALAVGAGPLVSLLGEGFQASTEILRILSVILFFQSLTFMMAAILVASNQQARRTVVQAVAVIFNTLLNLLIIGRLGITGVAYVYAATSIVTLAGYSFLAFRYSFKRMPGNVSQTIPTQPESK